MTADRRPCTIPLGDIFNLSLAAPPVLGISVRKAAFSHGLISEQVDTCRCWSGRESDKFVPAGSD